VAVLSPAITLTLGLGLSFSIVLYGGLAWCAIPITWLMVVHGARTLQVYICHQGIHGVLSGSAVTDRIVVDTISTAILVQGYDGYKGDHHGIHHPHLASDADVDRQFIANVMRIRPGADTAENKRRFIRALVSPRVHAVFFLARLRANLIKCPLYRRLAAIAWISTVAISVAATHTWLPFIVGCLFPLTVLYHISAMCQFVTEHFWTRCRQPGQSAKDHYLSMLVNRHLGDPLPKLNLSGARFVFAWAVWWARLFFYHLPVRLGILVGDLPLHGSHHVWPLERQWTNHIFSFHARSQASPASPIEQVGGYEQMLDALLQSFAEMKPIADSSMELSEAAKVANGM
jgi:hypothetical protein